MRLDVNALLHMNGPTPTDMNQVDAIRRQAITVRDRTAILETQGQVMADDEVLYCLRQIQQEHRARVDAQDPTRPYRHPHVEMIDPMLMRAWCLVGTQDVYKWVAEFCRLETCVFTAVMIQGHWIPFVMWPSRGMLNVHSWDIRGADHSVVEPVLRSIAHNWGLNGPMIQRQYRMFMGESCCGALAVAYASHEVLGSPLPQTVVKANDTHDALRNTFLDALAHYETCCRPWVWGAGLHEQTLTELSKLLQVQGVPVKECHARSEAALKAIGLKPISDALELKHPWKQLKTLGNMHKFSFLLPSELEVKIAAAAGKPRAKGGKKPKVVDSTPFQLDPKKLEVAAGVFHAAGNALTQLTVDQMGPLAEGIVFMSAMEAEPYLRAAQVVSKCPLAILVPSCGAKLPPCQLPHATITVPCRCALNQEPLLVEAYLIQLGTGVVEKQQEKTLVKIDAMDVATVKVLLYRDEIDNWNDVVSAPLKYVISHVACLGVCEASGCQCPKWHPPMGCDSRTVLLDVWRRQFLRQGFKPEQAKSASMFSACLRVPSSILHALLSVSGSDGIYFEPRSQDSRDVDLTFSVIWLPKADRAELVRLKTTYSSVMGLVRLGDRRGLRALAKDASELHQAVKPEAIYLAAGARTQYLAGPIPFGSDRSAVTKAFKQLRWNSRCNRFPQWPGGATCGCWCQWRSRRMLSCSLSMGKF